MTPFLFLGTTYVGGVFEVVTTNGATVYRHNILAGGATVAVHSITSAGAVTTDYVHPDHLGGVDTVTDDSGNLYQKMSFDTFGVRRDPCTWGYVTACDQGTAGLKAVTDRGYTAQEQLDNVGLIHMNGRVYDPMVGRFISADPIQGPNRYSYVGNNPLRYTDPSGYCFAGCFWQPSTWANDATNLGSGFLNAAGHIVDTGLNHLPEIAALIAAYYTGVAVDFGGSVSTGAVAGGAYAGSDTIFRGGNGTQVFHNTLRGAGVGAVGGGLLYGANYTTSYFGNNYFVGLGTHAVAGGLTSEAAGGSFSQGADLGGLTYSAYTLYQYFVNGEAPSANPGNGTQSKDPHFPASGETQKYNNFGAAVPPNATTICTLCEGSTFSNAMDSIPGMNALATLHDVWADSLTNGLFSSDPGLYYATFDIPTMLPAAALTYTALLNTPIGYGVVAGNQVSH